MVRKEEPEGPDLSAVIDLLRRAVHRMEPKYLSGSEAAHLVRAFAEVERLGSAGKTLAARAVERSKAWKDSGQATAAHWLAAETGVAVGQAVGTLETGRRLEHLPATEQAFASGELSETRVREVAQAAAACPSAEKELLEAARTETVRALKDQCSKVVASATDELDRYRAVHKKRALRHWVDVTGAFQMPITLTPGDGATVLAGMEPYLARIIREARKAGGTESREAYAADALVAMARDRMGSSKGPRSTVLVNVDHSALIRGHTEPGETSEIPGIGPIPVAVARAMMSDSILKVLVTDGVDVKAVANAGRTIPASLRTALDAMYPTCAVDGCDTREGLEIDHRIPFAEGGPTSRDNLVRLCHRHHPAQDPLWLPPGGRARALGPDRSRPARVRARPSPRYSGTSPTRILASFAASMFPPETTQATLPSPAFPASAAATDAAPAPSATMWLRAASSRTASATS